MLKTKRSGRIVLVVQAFPVISETFIVHKFRGLYDSGLDVHVLCARTDETNWSKFSALQNGDELKNRVHRPWPHRPGWLGVLLLPIVLLRSVLFRPGKTLTYLQRGYKKFGLDIFRRFYLDSELIFLNPDVIHFEFGSIAARRMYLGQLLNCKLAVSFRGYDLNFVAWEQQDFYREVWEHADLLHLLSEDLWRCAKKRGCPEDKPKVLIAPAVDSTFFQSEREIAASVGTRVRPFRILSVGRVEWKKGYEYALEAVKFLLDRGIECEYRIVGEGRYLQQIDFACHQFGLTENLNLVGVGSQGDVRDQMLWADVLLHPAISEGFCNAVLEAQSMKLPVVCSDAGGLPENVAHGVTGFVVPRRRAAMMAERLEALARDPDLREKMGTAGRARVTSQFAVEEQVAQLVAMYERLFDGDEFKIGSNKQSTADISSGVFRLPVGKRPGTLSIERKSSVDLIWLGPHGDCPKWELGEIVSVEPTPAAVHEMITDRLSKPCAPAWLFWDSALGAPDPLVIDQLLKLPGDVWHAGLKLSTGGLPGMIDFIAPTWMLNRDPDESILATSWRLSLRACLMSTEVLRQMGSVRPEFNSLDAAALELGHRLVVRGAITRHTGHLVSTRSANLPLLPFEDELRFTYYRYGKFWSTWALGRAVLTGYVSLVKAVRASREVFKATAPSATPPFKRAARERAKFDPKGRVSVLIPTLSRPQYLRTLLGELRHQTIRPFEIIVVDQTPVKDRDTDLSSDFADLPLHILHLDRAGQCSSRNAGLRELRGDYILFIDDDDQIPPDLIEKHLRGLAHSGAEVSSGVAEEDGAGPLPEDFTYARTSNVFPTNNSLVRKEALHKSGLFDLAFDRAQRADHDLGMRLYLSGALMMLTPAISVFHHHAPVGGLRSHKARLITYARSRQKVGVRHLPSVTEFYLAQRYFTPRQVREMFWLRVFGTFSVRGSRAKKLLKILTALAQLPDTLIQCNAKYREAAALLKTFPQIPELAHNDGEDNFLADEQAEAVSVAV